MVPPPVYRVTGGRVFSLAPLSFAHPAADSSHFPSRAEAEHEAWRRGTGARIEVWSYERGYWEKIG